MDDRDTILIDEPGFQLVALGRRPQVELDAIFLSVASRMRGDGALIVADLWGFSSNEAVGILADHRIPPHGD